MKVTWKPQVVQVGDLGQPGYSAAVFYDIKPVSKYDSDDTVWDTNRKERLNDAFTILETTTKNLCVEQWIYGDSFVACVKIEGNLWRYFKTQETTTPADDLEWLYVKYQMHAMVGVADKTVGVNDALQWAEQTVDFNTFNLPAFASLGLSSASCLLLGAAVSLLHF